MAGSSGSLVAVAQSDSLSAEEPVIDETSASTVGVARSRRWSRKSDAAEPAQRPLSITGQATNPVLHEENTNRQSQARPRQVDEPSVRHIDVAALLESGPAAEEAERAQRTRSGKDARGRRACIAYETLDILRNGSYDAVSDDGIEERIDVKDLVETAIVGSKHYSECGWHKAELPSRPFAKTKPATVRCCTVLAAMQELAIFDDAAMGVLNFASARNPGGGFTTGAEAQEESLARSSALYPCLMKHFKDFFVPNRNAPSGAYTHDLIYTPGVPVIRDETGKLLNRPYLASFVTSAAPNLGVMRRDGPGAEGAAKNVLRERIGRVLHTFAAHGVVDLVLGAWGCGVFQNDPATVAFLFNEYLTGPLAGRFRHVVFAVFDRGMAEIFTEVIVTGRMPTSANSTSSGDKSKGKDRGKVGGKGGKQGGRKGGYK